MTALELIAWRRSQGLSRWQLAAILGVAPVTVAKWEIDATRCIGAAATLLKLCMAIPETVPLLRELADPAAVASRRPQGRPRKMLK